jgi:hypothetical protein
MRAIVKGKDMPLQHFCAHRTDTPRPLRNAGDGAEARNTAFAAPRIKWHP